MISLERTVEWLRPLVETKAWDYCIVWKFGDDPSRFIEWVGCCCGGSNGDCKNVKEESGEHLLPQCKDTFIKHSARTIACERLAKFPSSLPLYSGVHGEVAMSNQPKWLSHEAVGTQVLIPVDGAMIELSSGKLVPKDQKIIDIMVAQFNIFVEHEKTSNPFVEHHIQVRTGFLPYLNFIPSLQLPSPVRRSCSYPSLEGSSTGSTPSSFLHVSPTKSIGKSLDSLGCDNSAVGKGKMKGRQSTAKEQYQSKNLVTERNRRIRIKDGLFALRALVPKITKMDRAAILGDAVDYIHELLKNIEELRDELRILEEEAEEEEEYNNSTVEFGALERKRASRSIKLSPTGHSSGSTEAAKLIGVQVEVNQIGSRDFLLRIVCNQKRGGFSRMMEAVISLGLQVIDASVTTCNGRVLNVLKVEVKGKEVEPKKLKDSLYNLVISDTPEGSSVKTSI